MKENLRSKKIHILTLKKQALPIFRNYKIRRAGVFGSYARGEATLRSDIDIAIDAPAQMGLFEIINLKNDLQKRLHKRVDLIEYGTIKPRLRDNILKDHISIL